MSLVLIMVLPLCGLTSSLIDFPPPWLANRFPQLPAEARGRKIEQYRSADRNRPTSGAYADGRNYGQISGPQVGGRRKGENAPESINFEMNTVPF